MSQVTPIWAQDLPHNYANDSTLKPIIEQLLLQRNSAPADYTLSYGIIRYKGKIVVGKNEQLRKQAACCTTLFTCRWTFRHKSQLSEYKGHFFIGQD